LLSAVRIPLASDETASGPIGVPLPISVARTSGPVADTPESPLPWSSRGWSSLCLESKRFISVPSSGASGRGREAERHRIFGRRHGSRNEALRGRDPEVVADPRS
jgi:hypothetical protein